MTPEPGYQMSTARFSMQIRRNDPDFYALSVMDHILGTGPGFTSRIARGLRDEQGLCYSVDAAITSSARTKATRGSAVSAWTDWALAVQAKPRMLWSNAFTSFTP